MPARCRRIVTGLLPLCPSFVLTSSGGGQARVFWFAPGSHGSKPGRRADFAPAPVCAERAGATLPAPGRAQTECPAPGATTRRSPQPRPPPPGGDAKRRGYAGTPLPGPSHSDPEAARRCSCVHLRKARPANRAMPRAPGPEPPTITGLSAKLRSDPIREPWNASFIVSREIFSRGDGPHSRSKCSPFASFAFSAVNSHSPPRGLPSIRGFQG